MVSYSNAQTVIGYLKVQSNSAIINLRIITVPDAMYAGQGVVKIKMPDGSEGAADLVPVNNAFASPVRIQTPYGTKSWRREGATDAVKPGKGTYKDRRRHRLHL
jgi:hypothetical protein